MRTDERVMVKWRPSLPGGALGDEVEVEMFECDYAEIQGRAARLDETVGPERMTLINEIRNLMDFFAYFPGASFGKIPTIAQITEEDIHPVTQPPAPKPSAPQQSLL